MRVLIVGGNKFFGRKLASLYIEGGHDVTLLNRGNRDDGFGPKVKRIVCDRNDEIKMHSLLQDHFYDVVYDQVCFDAHQATKACHIFKDKTSRYIFTSSMSVYPAGQNFSEFSFDSFHYKFDQVASYPPDYAEAKRQAESVFMQQKNFPVVAVRFPIVLGPDDYTERFKFHIDHVKALKPIHFLNINTKISCIHSDDAARALFLLGSSKFTGPLNVASPDAMKLDEMMSIIERVTNKKAFYDPAGDITPYGLTSDWTMDVSLAEQNNIRCSSVNAWLADLIRQLV